MQLIAHRGDPIRSPENTLASFRSAAEHGAAAVETDVRRTADGVWIAFHDPSLKRVAGSGAKVSSSRWDTIRERDSSIPAVSEVLDFCGRKRLGLFLDVKIRSHERELFDLIHRPGTAAQVSIGSGNLASLRRWRRLLKPHHPLFWVTGFRSRVTGGRIREARRLGLTGLLVNKRWATRGAVERAHAAGLQLFVWTVRTPSELRRLERLGVDGIMSEVWPPRLT